MRVSSGVLPRESHVAVVLFTQGLWWPWNVNPLGPVELKGTQRGNSVVTSVMMGEFQSGGLGLDLLFLFQIAVSSPHSHGEKRQTGLEQEDRAWGKGVMSDILGVLEVMVTWGCGRRSRTAVRRPRFKFSFPRASCVTSGVCLTLSEPRFPYL